MAAARDIGRGDADVVAGATHELYNRYGRQIYAYCLHQLSSREEAEDAVQTTFLNAFRGLQRGTVAHCEQAWLFKIAHNVCLSRQTSSWRRRRVESPNDFEVLQEIIPSPPRSGAEELIGLEDALEAMPENQRRAILLREWQGLSYREIAAELELSQASVEMLIFRARRSLAAALEPARREDAPLVGPRLDLGALLAGLKSALTGGAAVKVVLAAAAASTVGVAVQPVERTLVRRTAVHRAAAAPAPAATPVAAAAVVRETAAGPRMGVPAAAPAPSAHVAARAARSAPVTTSRTHSVFDQSPAAAEPQPDPAPAPAPSAPAPVAGAPAPSAPPPSAPAPAPVAAAPVEPVRTTSATAPTPQPLAATPPPAPAPASTVAPPPPAAPGNNGNGVGNGNAKNNGNAFGRAVPLPAAPVPSAPVVPAPPAEPVVQAPVAPGNNGNGNGNGNGKANGHPDPPPAAAPVPVPVTVTAPQPAVPPAPAPDAAHGNGKAKGH